MSYEQAMKDQKTYSNNTAVYRADAIALAKQADAEIAELRAIADLLSNPDELKKRYLAYVECKPSEWWEHEDYVENVCEILKRAADYSHAVQSKGGA